MRDNWTCSACLARVSLLLVHLLDSLVIGGSEDGLLYIWDVDTSCVVQTLGPCAGAVYAARWNPYQSLLASCGHDGIVRTWWYDGDTSGLGDAIANVDRPIL